MNAKKVKAIRRMIRKYYADAPTAPAVKEHNRIKMMPKLLPDGKKVMVPVEVIMEQVWYPRNTVRGLYKAFKRQLS